MKESTVICGGCDKKAARVEDGKPVYPLEDGKPGCVVCYFKTKKPIQRLCPQCQRPKNHHPDEDEQFTVAGNSVCENCYYEGLGEIVEKHPITSPRSGHGSAAG